MFALPAVARFTDRYARHIFDKHTGRSNISGMLVAQLNCELEALDVYNKSCGIPAYGDYLRHAFGIRPVYIPPEYAACPMN